MFKENCNICRTDGMSIDPFGDNVCNCNYIRGLRGILSLLDSNQRQKEFRQARKAVLNAQPLPPPCGLTHFRLTPKLANNTTQSNNSVGFEV